MPQPLAAPHILRDPRGWCRVELNEPEPRSEKSNAHNHRQRYTSNVLCLLARPVPYRRTLYLVTLDLEHIPRYPLDLILFVLHIGLRIRPHRIAPHRTTFCRGSTSEVPANPAHQTRPLLEIIVVTTDGADFFLLFFGLLCFSPFILETPRNIYVQKATSRHVLSPPYSPRSRCPSRTGSGVLAPAQALAHVPTVLFRQQGSRSQQLSRLLSFRIPSRV